MDFTIPLLTDFLGLVIPLKQSYNLSAILNAFELEVWLVILFTMPMYPLAMVMANYHYSGGHMKWEMYASFVIRASVSERRGRVIPNTWLYQKLLILFWCLPLFVLVKAYEGNMTALLTKPVLQKPVRDVDELVNENKMSWILEKDSSDATYLKSAPSGTEFTLGIILIEPVKQQFKIQLVKGNSMIIQTAVTIAGDPSSSTNFRIHCKLTCEG